MTILITYMKPPKYTPLIFFFWTLFSVLFFDSLNLPIGESLQRILDFSNIMLMAWWFGYPIRQKMLANKKENENGA